MSSSPQSTSLASSPAQRLIQPLLVLGSLLFSVGYVAMSIAAWGRHDWRGFFDSLPRAGVCAGLAALFVGTFAFGCNVSAGRHDRPANNWIFLPMFLAGVALGWVPAFDERRHIWTFASPLVPYAALIVFSVGAVVRIAAVRALGPRHSVWVTIQDDHRLLTHGLYRFTRHPSYMGALLAVLAWPLAFGSGAGLLLSLLMIPPILSRIAAEEELLIAEFGEEYRAYQRRTWRLVPFLY